ncbi:Microsomal signal peptidase subunit SPC25-like [Tubulinosema ratisbonensis]|uniref:Signal peptidase complex subunit 2 n=1 Tax=Tubulinosema ratisbonensis TaxID=291195 RepID=A0A437AI14_9MICR|nr:Microsomal signal peptidase subunit SPC25-like [Tubulinosema ratisbonensis]
METLTKKLNKNPIKSDTKSLSYLKISLDDLLTTYLTTTAKFTTSFFITDLRIFVGIVSTFCAVLVLYFSLYTEFSFYKPYATVLLLTYFLSNFLLEAYFFFFKNPVYVGKNKSGKKVRVFSQVNMPKTVYVLEYVVDKVVKRKEIEMTEVFGDKGTLFHEICFKKFDELFGVE